MISIHKKYILLFLEKAENYKLPEISYTYSEGKIYSIEIDNNMVNVPSKIKSEMMKLIKYNDTINDAMFADNLSYSEYNRLLELSNKVSNQINNLILSNQI